MPIALPATAAQREMISRSELVHLAKLDVLDQIITDGSVGTARLGPHPVYLRSFQGWSVFPFRLLRDYSIVDVDVSDTSYWGAYLYFFCGEPNWWAVRKNVGPLTNWDTVAERFAVIRVPGKAVLEQAGTHVFYRLDDRVAVVRGEYRGAAWIEFR